MSFYKNLEHKFAPIPEDKRIESLIFLDACSGSILPMLGEYCSMHGFPVAVHANNVCGLCRTLDHLTE